MKRFSLVLVLLLAGCGSSAGKQSTPDSTAPNPTTTATSVPGAPGAGLRGVPVERFECPPQIVPGSVRPTAISGPDALLLCPLATPTSPSAAVTLTSGQPGFDALVDALSAPDVPPVPNGVCALYADLPQHVLARAGARLYEVSIPTDGCSHYLRGALDALNHARGD